MEANEISYALSKQVGTAHTLSTTYGDLPLDTELSVIVEQAIRPILERRLALARDQKQTV